jgi:hypothetical protein
MYASKLVAGAGVSGSSPLVGSPYLAFSEVVIVVGAYPRRRELLPLKVSPSATATSGWRKLLSGHSDQEDCLLMVVSALVSLEGQRAVHVPPPTNPRSAHL